MSDSISRQAAIRWVKTECNPYGKPTLDFESGKKVIEHLEQMPSADRPQGEWMWHEDEDICNCSECKFEIDATGCIEPVEYVGVFRYCPNCGSRMKGVDDEQTN